jgi:hypothetical protein
MSVTRVFCALKGLGTHHFQRAAESASWSGSPCPVETLRAASQRRIAGILLAVLLIAVEVPAQQTAQARTVRPAAVTGDLLDMQNAIDGRADTRAYSGRRNYVGMSVTIDVGSLQNVIGVKQNSGPQPTHHVGAYRVEVAESPAGPWMTAFEGPGQRGESRTEFPAILARYIRITATSNVTSYNQEWSIAELSVGVDPGQRARRIPPKVEPVERPGPLPPAARTLKDVPMATDKKQETRASSGTPDYAGMSVTFDLGGEYELSRVVQVHGPWSDDYPAEYTVEVSKEKREDRFKEVWRGAGEPNRSTARFDQVTTRYIRITALKNRNRTNWWSIAELRTNRDPDVVEGGGDDERLNRQIRAITSRGFSDTTPLLNANNTTRATTNTFNYAGSWVQMDLGGSYTVSKVVQIHEPDREDYPGSYRIEISEDGRRWRPVFEGAGEPRRSNASFEPVRGRFVRITALANHGNRHWWSITGLRVRG